MVYLWIGSTVRLRRRGFGRLREGEHNPLNDVSRILQEAGVRCVTEESQIVNCRGYATGDFGITQIDLGAMDSGDYNAVFDLLREEGVEIDWA